MVHVIQFFQHEPSTRFFIKVFTMVDKHNAVEVKITCNLGSSVPEEFSVFIFMKFSVDSGRMFLQNNFHTRLLCVCVERHNPNASWIENENIK